MIDIESLTSVFGVSWDSSQPSTALTRLTKANDPNKLVTVDITTEPVPAVGTGSGSSPIRQLYAVDGDGGMYLK